ncbi:MAG: DNA mismatch repair protein [Halolamina sp.]|uniref:DNA mismatch repair protein n=1 Tax=Halolamina sp. TaxID=1940283 RepID=UPI002FC35C1F
MRLQEYWGIGPKTAELLEAELGAERAIEAIESADIRTLSDAGVSRGRATRILRRATGAAGLDLLGTGDTRDVYDDLLGLAAEEALTAHAADRIRVLTPLEGQEAAGTRLDRVDGAVDAWTALDDEERESVIAAFDRYDEADESRRAAVETARSLRTVGIGETAADGGTFARLAAVDTTALSEAADALGAVEGGFIGEDGVGEGALTVGAGADESLDSQRAELAAARRLDDAALDVLETVRGQGVRSLEEFQGAVIEYVATETGVGAGEVRAAAPDRARDETDFVTATLRSLVGELESNVADREAAVAGELREAIQAAGDDVAAAVDAVDELAFELSLARFAVAHKLRRPELVSDGLAVRGARNLFIGEGVQPVNYGVGEHSISRTDGPTPPSGDRVTVLTGANSGGKTTLLETLCQVALLASMGLPVPAAAAEVGEFDTVVFHRRHASFNAGVLESTLRSVVPPLTGGGRTLMLVDEFEAITEPGRAADLLNGLVDLTVDRGALGVFVTHLADDLSPLPASARIDGIFAEGLTDELALRVDYQPRFGTVGKSTPEFIVSRLVANASDRDEREAFRAIAAAVGEEAVQRTLSDAEWEA